MEFYRRFPALYAGDTRGLSFIEHGAYNLLLDQLYLTEQALPLDHDSLFRVLGARLDEEKGAVLYVIKRFFTRTRYGYTQKRFREELTFVSSRRYASKENGKKGGRPPKQKPTETQSVILGLQTHTNLEKPDSKTLDIKTQDNPSSNLTFMQRLGIPLSLFQTYKKMRERIHRPLIAGAEDLVFAELAKLQEQGRDPSEVLQDAIRTSSYSFGPNGKGKHESFSERNVRESQEVLASIRRNLNKMDDEVELDLSKRKSVKPDDRHLLRSPRRSKS